MTDERLDEIKDEIRDCEIEGLPAENIRHFIYELIDEVERIADLNKCLADTVNTMQEMQRSNKEELTCLKNILDHARLADVMQAESDAERDKK